MQVVGEKGALEGGGVNGIYVMDGYKDNETISIA